MISLIVLLVLGLSGCIDEAFGCLLKYHVSHLSDLLENSRKKNEL